jgi:STE24 endopeptidase
MTSASGPRGPLNAYAPVAVALAAVLFAFLVVWAIGPGSPPIDFERADAGSYFEKYGANGVETAEQYRSRSRAIGLFGIASEIALLVFLALYRGPPMRRLLARASSHPLRGAAAIGALLAVALALAGLPASILSFDLGRDYGLITQGLDGWAGDQLLALAVSVPLAALAAFAAFALWRRFRGRFWIAASVLAIAFAVLWLWLWPVAVSPIFNRFEPLPPGPVRSEALDLADRTGVDLGEVYSVDASRRSVALNAYVHGIGSSKRMVIYDNALETLPPEQLSILLAHELAHVESNDLYRGLGFAVLVIPLAALAMQLGTAAIAGRNGDRPDSPAVILTLALGLTVMSLLLSFPGNRLSREIEIRADYRALELTGDPEAMIGLQRQIAESNLSDPDPPALWHSLFGTHPATLDRIGLAEAWREQDPR